MSVDYPSEWVTTSLKDLFEFRYGKGLPQEKRNHKGLVNVYGSNGVVGIHDASITQGATIIIGRKGSVGEVHLSPQKCWPIDTTYFVDEFPCGLPPTYWALYLKSLRLGQQDKSSAIPGISRDDIYKIEIPLPPLREQRRIVAKLEKLLDKVASCQKRLMRIHLLLKRFRQSVLAAACSGRLTADWREQNLDLEAGASVLKRIREIRLESAQTKKERNQIQEAFRSEDSGNVLDELDFEQIPDSWITCRVGAIGLVVNGSTPSRKVPTFWNGEIPWVSSGEVRNNFITDTRERITNTGFDGCSVRLLPPGTVLLAIIGEGKTRGQTAVLKIHATINQNIAAVLLDHGLIISEYLWIWFQLRYERTREAGSGSGPQALNCQRVRELPFVLPPLDEQQEIVRRAAELFALADQVENRYAKAKEHVDNLKQSILAKAFRGELVPQDPNDEPANALLERIREARPIQPANRSRRKVSHAGPTST